MLECVEVVVFDFGGIGCDFLVCGVHVVLFRVDVDVVGFVRAQLFVEEFFCVVVRVGGVEVVHAGFVGGV